MDSEERAVREQELSLCTEASKVKFHVTENPEFYPLNQAASS
jgi:hypothetical protein